MYRNVDFEALERAINESGSLSKGSLEFGISDSSIHTFLKTRGRKVVSTWKVEPLNPDEDITIPEDEYKALEEVSAKYNKLSEIGVELGINDIYQYLRKYNIKLAKQFRIIEL